MTNRVDLITGVLQAISSGSTLFAKTYLFICRTERVKKIRRHFKIVSITFSPMHTVWQFIIKMPSPVFGKTSGIFFFFFFFCFDLGFTALSRIFHLYRANRSSKVGKNRRTRRKTTWPSISRTWLSHIWPEQGSNHSGEKPKPREKATN